MKLMKNTASMTNYLMANSKQVDPAVGMGVTILLWTDRYAGTIVQFNGTATLVVQEDKATRTDNNGMSESQSYRYEADPKGIKRTFRRTKNGRYKEVKGEAYLYLGERDAYHDYSF